MIIINKIYGYLNLGSPNEIKGINNENPITISNNIFAFSSFIYLNFLKIKKINISTIKK